LKGALQCGDTFELIDRPIHGISLHNLWQTVFRDNGDANLAMQQLLHLDEAWQRRLRQKIATNQ